MGAEDNSKNKIVVADLPMMWPKDICRFEREGGIWGQQYRQRRRQVTFAAIMATGITAMGMWFVAFRRRNTRLVLFSTFSGFTVAGFCGGMTIAPLFYENVCNNSETVMMRRVWWAKQCASNWNYSQVNHQTWKAQYPKALCPNKGWLSSIMPNQKDTKYAEMDSEEETNN